MKRVPVLGLKGRVREPKFKIKRPKDLVWVLAYRVSGFFFLHLYWTTSTDGGWGASTRSQLQFL